MSSYRNKAWYLVILTGISAEAAYKIISENLKRPGFIHEKKNAYAAYREVYGKDFASPEEMRALSQEEKIRRLEEENEKLKIEQRKAGRQASNFAATNDEPEVPEVPVPEKAEVPASDEKKEEIYATKEQFKAAHPELKGLPNYHAWLKYAKEHGLEK